LLLILHVSTKDKVSGLVTAPPPAEQYLKPPLALNARYGKGKVFSARHSLTLGLARSNREPRLRGGYAQGLGGRSWHMKRQKLSARPTTMRVELMTVR